MKKVILLLCIFISVRAFSQTGNLIIYTDKGDKIYVVLNDVKLNQDAQSNIKITGLSSPDYDLKVIFADTTIPSINNESVHLSEPGIGQAGEYTYILKKKSNGKYVLRYSDAVPMTQAAAPASGQLIIQYGAAPASKGSATTSVPGASPPSAYVPGYTGPIGCPTPMDASSFTTAKQSIASSSFDNTKEDAAKSVINNNCFTTSQVIEILNLFQLENTKLEVAEYAYTHTYDKGNYTKVNAVFNFDNSKSTLSDYISTH